MTKRILIIGGGLSGLALAEHCETRNLDYLLVEARSRFGGRIKSAHVDDAVFDLGPAWFWPGQPRIANMIARLKLETFEQYAQGDAIYEDERGQTQRARGFASMAGSWRLQGGFSVLIDTLANNLQAERLRLSTQVTDLTKTPNGITATFNGVESDDFTHAILAMPPRIAANIHFEPALPTATLKAMQNMPTWMAGQAKALALYERPFWRDAALSGDAISRVGPLGEIHDASPNVGAPYALFGFVASPPHARMNEDALKQQITAQLIRIFGNDAAQPKAVFLKDWATDRFTSTPSNHAPLYAHPTYGLPREMNDVWNSALRFAGTEVGSEFGGYLEGALEAAEHIAHELL